MGERVKMTGKVPLGSYGVKEEETYFVVGRILVGRCPIALLDLYEKRRSTLRLFCEKGRLFSPFLPFSRLF